MINKRFEIGTEGASLTSYILDDGEFSRKGRKRKAVIVCPGGGYAFCSKNEGEPVALFWNRHGYHAFVLEYSTGIKHPFPTALKELAEAMRLVKKHKEEWLIDDVSVIGFSAGGHLALSLACFYNAPWLASGEEIEDDTLRPSRVMLGYPAVTLEPIHPNSKIPPEVVELMDKGLIPDFRGPSIREILCGKEGASQEELESHNLLPSLHPKMPPVFAFGSYEDTVIKATDILQLASRLYVLKVPCEIHLYGKGPHGVSLCDETVKDKEEIHEYNMRGWTKLALNWMEGN